MSIICWSLDAAGSAAGVEDAARSGEQAEEREEQGLQAKPKAKRLLLSTQQIGYRPGTTKSSPRLLPAWV